MRRSRRSLLALAGALLATTILAVNLPGQPGNAHSERWKSGDVLFLDGNSVRSRIVRLAQGYSSDYSHVGIIVIENGVPFVVNADPAEGKVVEQRWDVVVAPREVCGGAVFRLKQPVDVSALRTACAAARRWARDGVPFNRDFDLNAPNELYCTELVWRAYQSAGIDLCPGIQMQHKYLLPAELAHSGKLEEILRF